MGVMQWIGVTSLLIEQLYWPQILLSGDTLCNSKNFALLINAFNSIIITGVISPTSTTINTSITTVSVFHPSTIALDLQKQFGSPSLHFKMFINTIAYWLLKSVRFIHPIIVRLNSTPVTSRVKRINTVRDICWS